MCTECEAGSFALRVGQTLCVNCGEGKYAITGTMTGQTYDICSSCAAGKYSSTVRALSESTCVNCPTNVSTTLKVGSTSILNCTGVCGPGAYSLRTNATLCGACPPGTYKQGTNHLSVAQCIDCPPGKYGESPGATSCSLCEAGTYINTAGSTECSNCQAGTYSAASAPNCSSCHEFASSPAGSSAEDCLCNAGYAGNGVSNCYKCKDDWSQACPCKAGYYGDPRQYGGCTECPAHSSSPEGSYSGYECICEAGYYRLEEFDYGTYTYTYTCNACPANSISREGSTSEYDCTCIAGKRKVKQSGQKNM